MVDYYSRQRTLMPGIWCVDIELVVEGASAPVRGSLASCQRKCKRPFNGDVIQYWLRGLWKTNYEVS